MSQYESAKIKMMMAVKNIFMTMLVYNLRQHQAIKSLITASRDQAGAIHDFSFLPSPSRPLPLSLPNSISYKKEITSLLFATPPRKITQIKSLSPSLPLLSDAKKKEDYKKQKFEVKFFKILCYKSKKNRGKITFLYRNKTQKITKLIKKLIKKNTKQYKKKVI